MISLPALFETLLKGNPGLHAAVRKSFDAFEPWLEQSGMPFFPGFTDHSPRHIRDVLETAASLFSDSSRNLLSAEDVTVLCMAILLHDSGMHLTQDGFRALIANVDPPIVVGLGDRSWAQLWKEFTAEAARFGQDKLIAIFGDAEPIRTDGMDVEDLSERDCLLIGEFVRRHHARLAHEIALAGVPTKSGTPLQLVGLDEELRDLAGLVARSHGLSIRSTFSYISGRYGLLPEYRKIKTPFLMAVLRIADYIQVQSERALKSLLSVKELRSPISRQEWRAHFAVRDVSMRHDDPEVLYVHAAPVDVKTYLKLLSLFKDIQKELDESWATIGEVYGRFGELSTLGLSLRRIRSNLDDGDKFSKTVPYVPIRAGFDASGPDLLKLLVGPLYDYRYGVGIRELAQNAIDACRELADLGGATKSQESDHDVLVEIREADDGTGWITVTDKGVGMTLDTVTRYFLIAGASFRNSDVWRRQHTDNSGNARVLRGGRFGVGALAAFLLGDEIRVQTRHISRPEAEGLEFTARMDDPIVELRRCVAPAGTSIRIWVSDSRVFDQLRPRMYGFSLSNDGEALKLSEWPEVDWFAQETPRIKYVWDGFNRDRDIELEEWPLERISAEYRPSGCNLVPYLDTPPKEWEALEDPSPYVAILWRYPRREMVEGEESDWKPVPSCETTVNGIRVRGAQDYSSRDYLVRDYWLDESWGPEYTIRRPSMAVFDPMGVCPINLQRSAVAYDRMGVDDRLIEAVLRKHFTIKAAEAGLCSSLLNFCRLCYESDVADGVTYSGQVAPFCITKSGVTIVSPHLFSRLSVKRLIFIGVSEYPDDMGIPILQEDEALLLRFGGGTTSDLSWFRGLFSMDGGTPYYAREAGFPSVNRRFAFSLISEGKWASASKKGRVNKAILSSLKSDSNFRKGFSMVSSAGADSRGGSVKRIGEVFDFLKKKVEVGVWEIDENPLLPDEIPLLCRLWGAVVETLTDGRSDAALPITHKA